MMDLTFTHFFVKKKTEEAYNLSTPKALCFANLLCNNFAQGFKLLVLWAQHVTSSEVCCDGGFSTCDALELEPGVFERL